MKLSPFNASKLENSFLLSAEKSINSNHMLPDISNLQLIKRVFLLILTTTHYLKVISHLETMQPSLRGPQNPKMSMTFTPTKTDKDCHFQFSNDECYSKDESLNKTKKIKHSYSDYYRGISILAPMVRAGILPFRMTCLDYGANLVYSEELIDKKLIQTTRVYNAQFDIIEYIHKNTHQTVFSTNEYEKKKLVLQIGTSNPNNALQAASLLSQDVFAIDINMGCPKSFSTKGGMGAALLKTPELACSILKTLTRNLNIPITCKIRLLDTLQETIDFAKACENCGISAITVHMRTPQERPSQSAHWDLFPAIKAALSIPVIANGDFLSRFSAKTFQESIGAESLMFARGALYDPSIFSNELHTKKDVIKTFLRHAMRCRTPFQSIKYILLEIISKETNKELKESLQEVRTLSNIFELFGLDSEFSSLGLPPSLFSLTHYHPPSLLQTDSTTVIPI